VVEGIVLVYRIADGFVAGIPFVENLENPQRLERGEIFYLDGIFEEIIIVM
jgi:hypothetical protein